MSYRPSVFCDNCEEALELPPDMEEADSEITGAGWLIVKGDENRDFCSNRCLAVWAGVQAGLPIE